MHDADFAGAYVPGSHDTQSLAVVALTLLDDLPAPQFWHTDSLVPTAAVEYLPAPQFWQTDSLVPFAAVEYLPAPQSVHVFSLVCAVLPLYRPAPHSVQAPSPELGLYVPASHSLHTLPDLVKPDLQVHASETHTSPVPVHAALVQSSPTSAKVIILEDHAAKTSNNHNNRDILQMLLYGQYWSIIRATSPLRLVYPITIIF